MTIAVYYHISNTLVYDVGEDDTVMVTVLTILHSLLRPTVLCVTVLTILHSLLLPALSCVSLSSRAIEASRGHCPV